VTELRPNTIIKDDAIPQLLRQQSQATFITINERDFWRKVVITEQFCVVCLTLPDSRTHEIPDVLRELFRHSEFKTKANRMNRKAVSRLKTKSLNASTLSPEGNRGYQLNMDKKKAAQYANSMGLDNITMAVFVPVLCWPSYPVWR
jgi:hypothetical protein